MRGTCNSERGGGRGEKGVTDRLEKQLISKGDERLERKEKSANMMIFGAYWLVLNTVEISLTNVQTLGYQQKLTNPELTI